MICCLAMFNPMKADAQQAINIPVNHGPSEHVTAWWWIGASRQQHPSDHIAPAILLLHGCGGMLNRQGLPDQRMRSYAELLAKMGWHVLALDSFSARGVKEICTRARGGRAQVSQTLRRADTAAAIAWLSRHEAVDKNRLGLMGWSNGGTTVLAYTHHGDPPELKASYPGLRAAVAFYPGCNDREQHGYQPAMPVLLLLALSDDWTPPEPCLRLKSENISMLGWENAFHGFDGTAKLRFRTDIRNGINPEGVHQGANIQAGEEARASLIEFFAHHFASK
jgi:dienelactone hydrolase